VRRKMDVVGPGNYQRAVNPIGPGSEVKRREEEKIWPTAGQPTYLTDRCRHRPGVHGVEGL
jgi:hypothetical protein